MRPSRLYPTLALLVPLALAGCQASDSPTGPDDGTDGIPEETRRPLGTFTFTRPSTLFQSLQTSVSSNGAITRSFSLSQSTQFAMRYASDYSAQIAIMPASQAETFENFGAVDVYGLWNGGAGTERITLGAGEYAIGIRSNQSVTQKFSWELDYDIVDLPSEEGYSFSYAGVVVSDALSVSANGGWAWQGFTVQEGYRYFLDGTNTRVDSWIIPADQVAAFESGGTFQYYSDYDGTNAGGPGLWEITLPPGTYYLAMRSNDAEVDGYITFVLERWAIH